jgi:hypothetical protein
MTAKTVIASAARLMIKDGGDHGSGVADTNPENEVGDVPGPVGRVVFAPDADAGGDEIKETEGGE